MARPDLPDRLGVISQGLPPSEHKDSFGFSEVSRKLGLAFGYLRQKNHRGIKSWEP
jgi:hypothetical protein